MSNQYREPIYLGALINPSERKVVKDIYDTFMANQEQSQHIQNALSLKLQKMAEEMDTLRAINKLLHEKVEVLSAKGDHAAEVQSLTMKYDQIEAANGVLNDENSQLLLQTEERKVQLQKLQEQLDHVSVMMRSMYDDLEKDQGDKSNIPPHVWSESRRRGLAKLEKIKGPGGDDEKGNDPDNM